MSEAVATDSLQAKITAAFDRIQPLSAGENVTLDENDLAALYDGKFGVKPDLGPGPKLNKSMGYYSPDIYYEALVAKLVNSGCEWLDVGCGRDIFPHNRDLASHLSKRAGFLFGVDPDENIKDNEFVHDRYQGMIEDSHIDRQFDVATLRMVAEHIADPQAAMSTLDRYVKPGGVIVVYTPNKWSPISVLAKFTPMAVHHFFKRLLWKTEERDTFPVEYKMNTRKTQQQLFAGLGYTPAYFEYVDDCRTFAGFLPLLRVEIGIRNLLQRLNLHYPENCLLAVYRKPA